MRSAGRQVAQFFAASFTTRRAALHEERYIRTEAVSEGHEFVVGKAQVPEFIEPQEHSGRIGAATAKSRCRWYAF